MSGLFVIMALPVLWRGRGATSQPRGKMPAGGCAVRQTMFQTRVNPNTLERVASSRAGAEYWLSSCADDVRPYGFLLRKAPVFGGEGKWVCNTDQGPVAYSTEDAAALEQAFALGVPRVVPVRKGVNEVNLDSMKQINVTTRVERPVTRL